jgi:hypothetical protein
LQAKYKLKVEEELAAVEGYKHGDAYKKDLTTFLISLIFCFTLAFHSSMAISRFIIFLKLNYHFTFMAMSLFFVSLIFCRLNYVIVRPGIVYGLGDKQGLSKFE